MEKLNNQIIKLLKEHKEGGEKFFNALDLMIRSDYSIFNMLTNKIKNYFHSDTMNKTGVILSGKFGYIFYNNFSHFLNNSFKEVIITNGGIREGREAYLGIDSLKCNEFIFIDDSYYSGKTKKGIEEALQNINPNAKITETFVVYDGSKSKSNNVISLFRYYDQSQGTLKKVKLCKLKKDIIWKIKE